MVNHVFLAALVMIITILATARSTHVFTQDYIAEPFREAVKSRFGNHLESKLTYVLAWCQWCNSFWTALFWNAWALGASVWLAGLDFRVAFVSLLPLALATSYAASRLIDLEGEDD